MHVCCMFIVHSRWPFLSVQCHAMHGQNIDLPVFVCVCLCVRHTFCKLSYGQTHQRIFTVGSLKDADLLKDAPFGGLDDE